MRPRSRNLLLVSVFIISYLTDGAGGWGFEKTTLTRRTRQAQQALPSVRPEWVPEWPDSRKMSETAKAIVMEGILPRISEEFARDLPGLVENSLKTSPGSPQGGNPYPVQTMKPPKVSFIIYTTPKAIPGEATRLENFFRNPAPPPPNAGTSPSKVRDSNVVYGFDPPIRGSEIYAQKYQAPAPSVLQQTQEKSAVETGIEIKNSGNVFKGCNLVIQIYLLALLMMEYCERLD